ncbi:hypothetical protein SKAU_G00234310 [Synaphobranchus kaupii]|uniref:DDE-1 domain-containing protein n=1 Tax=Synaphobranchus kaupii TaxID=118154 RepID=A0A9Q1ISN8_SYNKA|nr:hypothetical protein SKAU_G00234310 [Synaphobranchus kaupii]
MLPKDDLRPHMLLLDGHTSHVYNIEFLRLMQAHRVHVVFYPSHTTHCLQPADKSLFKSLKHHWNQEGRSFMRLTGGRKLLKGEFFSLFGRAWRRAATVQTAQAGFRRTAESPLEPEGRAWEPEQLELPEIPDWIGAEVAVGEDATDRGQGEVFVPPADAATEVESVFRHNNPNSEERLDEKEVQTPLLPSNQ